MSGRKEVPWGRHYVPVERWSRAKTEKIHSCQGGSSIRTEEQMSGGRVQKSGTGKSGRQAWGASTGKNEGAVDRRPEA